MEMTDKWKAQSVLLAGCGSIGKRHVEALLSLGVKNIRVCDPNHSRVQELQSAIPSIKGCYSYEKALADSPDAVFILTPTDAHISMACAAVEAGCHVFIEKPLSTSTLGVNKLILLSEHYGRKVMVGFCFRFHEGLLMAKKQLDSGVIGRLVSIRALMGEHFPDVRPDYRETHYARYSGALELVHDLDLSIWLAGQKVKKVHGACLNLSDIGISAPDTVEIILEFVEKCVASVHLDFFQIPRRRQMELIGTEGTIIVEFASWNEYSVSTFIKEENEWKVYHGKTNRNAMFEAEDREFLEIIASDRPVRCDINEGLKSLTVIESLLNGKESDNG